MRKTDLVEVLAAVPNSENECSDYIKRLFGLNDLSDLNGVVIFGAAKMGRRFARTLKKNGITIRGFSDNMQDLWGKNVEGLTVLEPKLLANEEGLTVIIATRYIREIGAQLERLGVTRIIPHYVLTNIYPDLFPNKMHENMLTTIVKEKTKILELDKMLVDTESHRVLRDIIYFRTKFEWKYLPTRSKGIEYFPDFFELTENEKFIDVGAFTGDTLDNFMQITGGKFSSYIALEPDRKNFIKLEKKITSNLSGRVKALQIGAGGRNCEIHFSESGSDASSVDELGTNIIKVVKLDDLDVAQGPSFVKIDVEGFEPEVIKGMSRLLKKEQPKLALCVYHRSEHLWRLPFEIIAVNGKYKRRMYLRHYEDLFDTVFYTF